MTTAATRSELLARRRQMSFARQGRDLIFDKRTALLREFHRLELDLLGGIEELAGWAAAARQALLAAEAVEGPAALSAAALAAGPAVAVTTTERAIAGVRVIQVEAETVCRTPETRGWAPVLVPSRIDEVATRYEHYLDRLLAVCALELTVRRLATEIARATRQVNALEHVVIPRLEAESRAIGVVLEEREREDLARLKRVRSRRILRADSAGGLR